MSLQLMAEDWPFGLVLYKLVPFIQKTSVGITVSFKNQQYFGMPLACTAVFYSLMTQKMLRRKENVLSDFTKQMRSGQDSVLLSACVFPLLVTTVPEQNLKTHYL
ncbi:unnamed protein product [Coregonus sp. 'balchen']|nr:unnamed protein product [Coregonus sp. 'balchen']